MQEEQSQNPEDFGSSAAGRKGGKARAKALTPEQRSAIARTAAETRWEHTPLGGQGVPRAVCGGDDHPLVIGDITIPCYVLDDERRVISMRGVSMALSLAPSGGAPRLAQYVGAIGTNPSNSNALAVRLNSPIVFRPRTGGKLAHGYEATLLADICDAILDARQHGDLTKSQLEVAKRAEVLVRGWARVGIIAMVDEATGFQYVRSRTALSEILSKFISDKLMPWTKRFPDEFYTEMFRLKGWDYANLKPGDAKPSIVGWYTRNIVYQRLAPGVIHELERLNPPVGSGRRRDKHHQWLTADIGHTGLREHLAKVVTTMQLSEDWDDFRRKLRRVLPKRWEQFEFEDMFPNPPADDSTAGGLMPDDLD